jgi:hypothetical protein
VKKVGWPPFPIRRRQQAQVGDVPPLAPAGAAWGLAEYLMSVATCYKSSGLRTPSPGRAITWGQRP